VHTARTPAHEADVPRPAHHQRRQSPPARGPAGLDAHLPPDEELLARLGDAIDDRIAEIVDELLEERNSPRQHRPGRCISAVSLILAALAASALLRHSPIAWTSWPSAAVISLATAWTARAGRSAGPSLPRPAD
jgi:hypothetical protein